MHVIITETLNLGCPGLLGSEIYMYMRTRSQVDLRVNAEILRPATVAGVQKPVNYCDHRNFYKK